MHALPCLGPVTTHILPGEGIGGFLLYHTEINLVGPPTPLPPQKKRLCGVLMTPFIGSQCSVAPSCTLLAMTVSPPCYPENHVIPPSFFLPPPPVINNDRCFTFNFPLSRKKQSHIVSLKNMSSTSRKWETLIVFPFLLVVVVFVSVFVFFLFLFLFCFFYYVILMLFLPNFCMYLKRVQ